MADAGDHVRNRSAVAQVLVVAAVTAEPLDVRPETLQTAAGVALSSEGIPGAYSTELPTSPVFHSLLEEMEI